MITNQTNLKSYIIDEGGFPPDLVEEIIEPSTFDLCQITNGVILVFARWSPFGILAVRAMRDIVPAALQRSNGKLLVVDNDKLSTNHMERLFGRILHGAGETFAVVGGMILGQANYCDQYPVLITELVEKLSSRASG